MIWTEMGSQKIHRKELWELKDAVSAHPSTKGIYTFQIKEYLYQIITFESYKSLYLVNNLAYLVN